MNIHTGKTTGLWAVALAVLLLAACEKENDKDRELSILGSTTAELLPVVNNSATVSFEALGDWTASTTSQWLAVSPTSGEAGSHSLTLTATQTNRTKAVRTAQVTIKCGSASKTITVKQDDGYAIFDQDTYSFEAGGGVMNVTFKTNLKDDDMQLYASEGLESWVIPEADGTRAEQTGRFVPLRVQPNTTRDARDGALFLTIADKQGNPLPLDTLWIHQDGLNDGYTSTDYTADGQVERLQTATKGRGIPLVLMGDGFTDLEVNDGTYMTVMERTMENIFSEEPIHSLREYFDIWAVKAVSANNTFTETSKTAFSCMPDNQSTEIRSDDGRIGEVVRSIEGIDSLNTLAIVVLNSSIYKGVTYLYSNYPKAGLKQYAVALFPVIDHLESERFRAVAIHEAVGHGLAKLADEYAQTELGAATADDLDELSFMHRWGWMMNVDKEESAEKVLWKDFIGDNRFTRENIGVYEGGFTFFKGIFRPTEDSMMNTSTSPFNAPSRRLIYNKIIELGEGRTPTYEEFAAFDEAHKPQTWDYSTRSSSAVYRFCLKKSCISWRHSGSSTPPRH